MAWSNIARYMAHEIKNPLTPIKLSAQRIEVRKNKKFLILNFLRIVLQQLLDK